MGDKTVMPSKHKQSVFLSGPQLVFLKKEADRLGITVSDLIRRIVDQYRQEPRQL